MRRHFHRVMTGFRMPAKRRKTPRWHGALSRPCWRVRRTSGSRATAAALTPRGTSGGFRPRLRISRARCRSSIPPRARAGCWYLTLIPPPLAVTFMVLLSGTIMNVAQAPRPRSALRLRPSPISWSAAAAGSSPTYRHPAAATSTSCSPRRCRGSSCVTSPGPSRCAFPRSTRRRCRPSAARSALPAPVTSPEAGGCSRCRRRTPGAPLSTRTGRRCGPRCWPSSRPSCAGSNLVLPAPSSRMRPRWTTPASRGCPVSAAAPLSAPTSSVLPAPDGGTDHAIRAAARRV